MSDRRDRDFELVWPGKYGADGLRAPIERVGAHLQTRERIPGKVAGGDASEREDVPGEDAIGGKIVLGDNLAALDALGSELRGKVDLAYIDPPFATGSEFSAVRKLGEGDTTPELRVPAYADRWPGGPAGLVAMLDDRLRLIHELLADTGSLYVHVDPTVGHAVKLLLDDVFGPRCFQREIVWRIGWLSGFKTKAKNWIRNHDLIFFYVKNPQAFTFNKHYVPHPEGYLRRDGKPPTSAGVPLEDVWNANTNESALSGHASLDSIQLKSFSREKTGWATQKNLSVLERIIAASSNPGDLVLDAFAGSGTTAVAAARLGRRYVICEREPLGTFIARSRLLELEERGPIELCAVDDPERAAVLPSEAVEFTHAWDENTGKLRLDLQRIAWPGGEEVPTEVRELDWKSRLEAWAVGPCTGDDGEVLATVAESHRTHHKRDLELSAALAPELAEVKLEIRAWDVLGNEVRTSLVLPAAQGLAGPPKE